MIFSSSAVCHACFCTQSAAQKEALLPAAPVCAVLLSSGNALLEAQATGTSGAHTASFWLKAGDILLACGAVRVVPQGPCHWLAAGLEGSAAAQAAGALASPLSSDTAACPQAAPCMARLAATEESAAPTDEAAYGLLCALAHADEATARLPAVVREALEAIRENYAGLYGVEELSAQLGVSKCHLVRVFGAALGKTPGQYLTEVRVGAAKQLLENRTYSLEVVASLCGFSGANYLCKVFKRTTGQTPAVWRAQHAAAVPRSHVSAQEAALYV